MFTQIVVPVKKRDEVNHLLPYLQVLAKPGSKIVFLWPYREETSWMEVQLAAMQTQITVKRFAINTSIERQSRWFEEAVCSVRESLEAKGVNVAVQCYRGSVRSGIASVREARAETVVLCPKHRLTAAIVIARVSKLLRLLSSAEAEPILYLRPGSQH
jgi:hypothetical protein